MNEDASPLLAVTYTQQFYGPAEPVDKKLRVGLVKENKSRDPEHEFSRAVKVKPEGSEAEIEIADGGVYPMIILTTQFAVDITGGGLQVVGSNPFVVYVPELQLFEPEPDSTKHNVETPQYEYNLDSTISW